MSKERPILFSGPMVRALLDGSKTQTRRVVKQQMAETLEWFGGKSDDDDDRELAELLGQRTEEKGLRVWCHDYPEEGSVLIRCPYGQPGDRLWVREAFRFPESIDHLSPEKVGNKAISAGYPKPWCPTQFEADSSRRTPQEWRDFVTPPQANDAGRLRAGMHMPRWASRITLEITRVRVERLQDIREADAQAEGIAYGPTCDEEGRSGGYHWDRNREDEDVWPTAVQAFRQLWIGINGPDSWAANPWVWSVEFRKLP